MQNEKLIVFFKHYLHESNSMSLSKVGFVLNPHVHFTLTDFSIM
ncbi:hypothetical protein LM701042_60284 [Listeria monocytogenes]|nr:hypothetical protein LM600444_60284 [Listeria monocytogenes]CUK98050.1 hypothetical protein LM701042_60284 [Listeria monocytogenes]